MVFSSKIFEYLDETSTLESDPLLQLSNDGELNAFVHDGFFEPMDTYREYLNLNKLWDSGQKPWTKILTNLHNKKFKTFIFYLFPAPLVSILQ